MPYKVYISTSNDPTGHGYARTVYEALWNISELGFMGVEREQQGSVAERWQTAQQIIQDSDIFIGVYSQHTGSQMTDTQQPLIEREYMYANGVGVPAFIFVEREAYEQATTQEKTFLSSVMQQQVVQQFRTDDELAAKVKLAVETHKRVKDLRPKDKLTPPLTLNFRDALDDETDTATVPDADAEFEALVDRAIGFAQDDIEQIVRRVLELHSAQNRATLENYDNKITVSPIWGEPIRRSQFETDIFMIMPFSDYDSLYREIVIPVAAEQNMTVKRGDEFATVQGVIMEEVWAALYKCRLVIAETTEYNPNVYYELGIAHTLGKPTILLTQRENPQDVPFDIRHLRFIRYEDSIDGVDELRKNLKETMIWLLNDLDERG